LKKDAVPSIFSWKKKLDTSLQDARSRRLMQKRLKPNQNRLMVRSPNFDSCLAVDVEENDNDKLMEPVLPSSRENTNHYIIDIPLGCEIEVKSTSNLYNTSVNQSIEERASCPKAKAEPSQNKTFANAATQTFFQAAFTVDTFVNKPWGVIYYTGLESLQKFKLVLYSLGKQLMS